MSGDEFVEKFEAGALADPNCADVARLSMLIPFAKRP